MSRPNVVKTSIVNVVRRLGYEIVPSARVMPREIAQHLGTLLGILNISCVLDVGANSGQYRDFLRYQVGFAGMIISFEPVARLAQALQARTGQDPLWAVYPWALGAENGVKSFNVMRADTLSSFLAPDASALDLFARNNIVDHIEKVQIRTLDSALEDVRKEHELGRSVFLKMDTQGYDLEVIKGATQSLPHIAGVQTELSFQKLYAGMPGYLDVLAALDPYGFEFSGLFPVNQDTSLRLIEADCVLVNRARVDAHDVRLMWTNEV